MQNETLNLIHHCCDSTNQTFDDFILQNLVEIEVLSDTEK